MNLIDGFALSCPGLNRDTYLCFCISVMVVFHFNCIWRKLYGYNSVDGDVVYNEKIFLLISMRDVSD